MKLDRMKMESSNRCSKIGDNLMLHWKLSNFDRYFPTCFILLPFQITCTHSTFVRVRPTLVSTHYISCALRLIYFSWSLTWEMISIFFRSPKGQIRVSISGSVIQIHFTKIYYYLNKWFNQYGKRRRSYLIGWRADENRLNLVKIRWNPLSWTAR